MSSKYFGELNYDEVISNYNFSERKGQSIKYIVIHDTGNMKIGANAYSHARYFGRANRNASAHYFVDDKNIIKIIDEKYASWHCGDGRGRKGITNQNSIGVEICVNMDSNYDKAVENTQKLCAYLLDKYKLDKSRVVRHFDVSGKICPSSMRHNNWKKWEEFLKNIPLFK